MKGGLSKTKTKTYSINTTFNDFAINILSESIIAQEQGRRTQSAGAGFKDDFSTWLKMFADPIHDFNRTHPGFNLHNQRLFRIYDNILKYQRKSLEDEILLALLQDTRASHGISLKYMRFYKKPIVQPTITVIDDDTEMVDINQIWVNVESAFGEYNDKFYIFNSAITGLGTKDQFAPISYNRITPLPVLWDSVPSKHRIDFSITPIEVSNLVYDTIYEKLHRELEYLTGIKLAVREVNRLVVLHIYAKSQQKSFLLQAKGFPIPKIKEAIDAISNSTAISDKEIAEIIAFLRDSGIIYKEHLISFLLVCKMSGDAGQVEFLDKISSYNGEVTLHNSKGQSKTQIIYPQQTLFFLYTGDRLCATNAITNNVKCVFGYAGNIAQFLGSNAEFNVATFLREYSAIIDKAYRLIRRTGSFLNLLHMIPIYQFAEIVSVYYELFSYVVGHSIVARDIHQSSRQDSGTGTVDDFVRYVIAITALVDIHDRFDRIIAKIVKRSKWTKEDLLNENGKFDPLIRFFANALVIPDAADESRKQVLQFLADKLLNTKRIIIGNDYTMLSARF